MKLSYTLLELPLEFRFTISRSSSDVVHTVLVTLHYSSNGKTFEGLGEAVPSKFYGEDAGTVIDFYERIGIEQVLSDLTPFDIQILDKRLKGFPGDMAAKAAIDTAFYDLQGKILNRPLYQLWGLDPLATPKTSYTLGIADAETMTHKTKTALNRGYDVIKLKLGSPQDVESLKLVRDLAPHVTLRVDANAAWTLPEALSLLPVLEAQGVEFVEEPLKLNSPPSDYTQLKTESPLPLMADESCHVLGDIPYCAQYFHAINLKLTKTGGLTEAHKMVSAAKAHGLSIMLGCFSETSVSITAFSHLSPLVDYADLDGALLLANDPFDGVQFEGSQIKLPNGPGLGVNPRSATFSTVGTVSS